MYEIFAALLILLALLLFWRAGKLRKKSGLPEGRIIYSDTRLWGEVEKPFYDVDTQLTGKPDYIIRKGKTAIPVEVKSHYSPQEPYDSHVFQLIAYCYLIEKTTGTPPAHGIIQYRNRAFSIDYGTQEKNALLDLLDEMRASAKAGDCPRSHEESIRCLRCGFNHICDQRL